jgi:hypothetical protein
MKQRIRGYTKGTEKRLTERLKEFIRSHENERAVFVTLTTVETDPAIAKPMLHKWAKRILRQCNACGVHVLEFMDNGQVHFHLLLVLRGELALKPTATVAGVFWDAWKDLGDHDRQAFNVEPANLREPSWVLSYMPKADIEPGVPHPERHQKRSPVAFAERGLGVAYWGSIGRARRNKTDGISFQKPVAACPTRTTDEREAA